MAMEEAAAEAASAVAAWEMMVKITVMKVVMVPTEETVRSEWWKQAKEGTAASDGQASALPPPKKKARR